MPLRNLPTNPEFLSDLIHVKAGQVSSMEFSTATDDVDITLLAFSEKEGVSETYYPTQTCYFCVEGTMSVTYQDGSVKELTRGQIMLVEPEVSHSIEGKDLSAFKVLQINL